VHVKYTLSQCNDTNITVLVILKSHQDFGTIEGCLDCMLQMYLLLLLTPEIHLHLNQKTKTIIVNYKVSGSSKYKA